ncbi:hypothetical protein HPB50_019189 [Hyalomma asiaticum]|uniref:Uncharacterized protein n=1 Tax=Hyalomma asiaticum TaxID=266040 RepID=A0ACB7SA51_HYAAI|nr:hypothetical protein HPB50_019189 [Hyalomma asiaticum]
MDVDSPGRPSTPSTSSATGARKRSGEQNDADSEDTLIRSSASESSSYDSDFVPVTRRKAKGRLFMASSSRRLLPKYDVGVLVLRGITGPADAWPGLPTKNPAAEPLHRPPKLLRNGTVAIVMIRKS